jgi:hypothetical protein
MMRRNHEDGLVLAITGGVDSSVLGALCLSLRPPVPIKFVFMGFKPEKEILFQKWASKTFPHVSFTSITPTHPDIPEFGSAWQLRKSLIGSYINYESNQSRSLALAATTRSEYRLVKAIGPDVFDAYPFIDLYRGEVAEIGKFLELPPELLASTSIYEESLGMTFDELEWADRENDNNGIISSNDIPTTSRYWGIYGQRQKEIIAHTYNLNKYSKHNTLQESKLCFVRKYLPGVLS